MTKPVNVRRAAREQAGVSEKQAARAVGLRLSTFRQYERASGFPFERAEVLARFYDCRTEVLK